VVGALDYLYAVNATTGAKLWNYTTAQHLKIYSPTVANGVVYFNCDDKNVYALNANNSTKLWIFTTGSAVSSSPAVANGVVYFGSEDHNLYAINAATGAKLWNYTTATGGAGSPVVSNGVVYFTAQASDGTYTIYAVGNSSASAAQSGSPIPGFEAAFAVVALAIGAYVVSKKS